jgi:hypothetical protein
MGLLNIFRRKKVDDEPARRARLVRTGRVVEGIILDVRGDSAGGVTHIFYSYVISGVGYESSQALDDQQRLREAEYAPGARVTVRYDRGRPFSSVVV